GGGDEVPRNLPLREGDVIGCGVSASDGRVFFTRNGALLPASAVASSLPRLRPMVVVSGHCETVEANFGPFFAYRGDE
ncbi:unnamed protein product, partial [Phaeothamnion confervicola]